MPIYYRKRNILAKFFRSCAWLPECSVSVDLDRMKLFIPDIVIRTGVSITSLTLLHTRLQPLLLLISTGTACSSERKATLYTVTILD